jgi:hypothetical protein
MQLQSRISLKFSYVSAASISLLSNSDSWNGVAHEILHSLMRLIEHTSNVLPGSSITLQRNIALLPESARV